MKTRTQLALLALAAPLVLAGNPAQAGVFSTPHFVTPGEYALGLEPEFTLTHGAGIGVNGRFTYGLSDLLNATAIAGTGGGPRQLRVGGNVSLDLFPDVEGQPGIGIAGQPIYYRTPDGGRLEMTAIPYIHKSFSNSKSQSPSKGDIEPFFAFPFGFAFTSSTYEAISTVVVGSMFKASENVHYVVEGGVAVNNTESYISGGIVYYH